MQLAIYKRSREAELGASENNISWRSERDLNPRPTDFKSDALTTRPRCNKHGKSFHSAGLSMFDYERHRPLNIWMIHFVLLLVVAKAYS